MLVRSVSGDIVGHGDFLQAVHSDRVESRLVLASRTGMLILTEDVPAFVRCDGPLYLRGPVWRMETTSAR